MAIIESLLDIDFYKFTMGQFIFNRFRDVSVRFGFTNRTKGIVIAREIDEDNLRLELDHVRTLRFSNSDLHYLRGIKKYSEPMFHESYLEFLRDLILPPYELEYRGDEIRMEFPGKWSNVTYWETIALSIINELYFRGKLEGLSYSKQDLIYDQGKVRLEEKIRILKEKSDITIIEFGTRRRFSKKWHSYVLDRLVCELPPAQVRGTSNTFLSMKYGLHPMGTNAHELAMVLAGISDQSDEGLRNSQHQLLRSWWEEYGEELSVILPDTFGSEFLFQTISKESAQCWKGFRHDSGDPIIFGERVIKFYENLNIDPRKKLIVFSDGLDLKKIITISERFRDRIMVNFGWGTNLTNDMGFRALSIVVKAIEANGHKLVKLSDNIEKAICPKDEVVRYKRIFGYNCNFSETPIY